MAVACPGGSHICITLNGLVTHAQVRFPPKCELESIKGNELRAPRLLFISSSAGVVSSAPLGVSNAMGKVDELENTFSLGAKTPTRGKKIRGCNRCVQGRSLKLSKKKEKRERNNNK